MRKMAFVAAVATAIGLAIMPAASGITFGEPDENRHPAVGALLVEFDGELSHFCSGSLIAPDVFLTAAHCIFVAEQIAAEEDIEARFFVSFDEFVGRVDADGEFVLADGVTLISGEAFFDERFGSTGKSHPYDIGVIVLEEAVGIGPVELPTEGYLNELYAQHDLRTQTFVAVGYGAVRDDFTGGFDRLRSDVVERLSATQSAINLQKRWLLLSMNPNTGSGGTCYGDSGGPHFIDSVDPNLQVSITITGDAVCKATDLTYRLDTPEAREFLAQFVDLP